MTTYFDLPLWIDWDDIMNRADYFRSDLEKFSPAAKDAVLQVIHDFLILDADSGVPVTFKDDTTGGSPGSSQLVNGSLLERTAWVRQIQTAIGAWAAAFSIDNPAGTGSLSGVSIDAFSVSNTMAKNNSTAMDLQNANQYGTQAYQLWEQRPDTRMMI